MSPPAPNTAFNTDATARRAVRPGLLPLKARGQTAPSGEGRLATRRPMHDKDFLQRLRESGL